MDLERLTAGSLGHNPTCWVESGSTAPVGSTGFCWIALANRRLTP